MTPKNKLAAVKNALHEANAKPVALAIVDGGRLAVPRFIEVPLKKVITVNKKAPNGPYMHVVALNKVAFAMMGGKL